MIDFRDISVIIQGAVHPEMTKTACDSVRIHLPGACIILSTWEGADVSAFDYDELVMNSDPGGFKSVSEIKSPMNNVNRQIVSTLNGLKAARTKYAIKMRTDFALTSSAFLGEFEKYPCRGGKMRIGEERIIAYPSTPTDAAYKQFHVGDFYFFGLRGDLLRLFDIPLVDEGGARYFPDHEPSRPMRKLKFECRYLPEQWLTWNYAKAHVGFEFADMYDDSPEIAEACRVLYANNFLFLKPRQFGIETLKPELSAMNTTFSRVSLGEISYYNWKLLYRKYCDPAFRTSISERLKNAFFAPVLVRAALFFTLLIPSKKQRSACRMKFFNAIDNILK